MTFTDQLRGAVLQRGIRTSRKYQRPDLKAL